MQNVVEQFSCPRVRRRRRWLQRGRHNGAGCDRSATRHVSPLSGVMGSGVSRRNVTTNSVATDVVVGVTTKDMNNPKSTVSFNLCIYPRATFTTISLQALGWGTLVVAAGVSYIFAKKGIDERREKQKSEGSRPTEKLDCTSIAPLRIV